MIDKQKERLLKQVNGLIKKCKELDRLSSLSQKETKGLTIVEARELRKLGNKLLRWSTKITKN